MADRHQQKIEIADCPAVGAKQALSNQFARKLHPQQDACGLVASHEIGGNDGAMHNAITRSKLRLIGSLYAAAERIAEGRAGRSIG